jgi:hypothetical protein
MSTPYQSEFAATDAIVIPLHAMPTGTPESIALPGLVANPASEETVLEREAAVGDAVLATNRRSMENISKGWCKCQQTRPYRPVGRRIFTVEDRLNGASGF